MYQMTLTFLIIMRNRQIKQASLSFPSLQMVRHSAQAHSAVGQGPADSQAYLFIPTYLLYYAHFL